jgi:regulator of nonsense transcripts 3
MPPKLKVQVRRLPPGLTESEFYAIVGDEWKLGAGKVDWARYAPGTISKE